jgi:hypothetical protein
LSSHGPQIEFDPGKARQVKSVYIIKGYQEVFRNSVSLAILITKVQTGSLPIYSFNPKKMNNMDVKFTIGFLELSS